MNLYDMLKPELIINHNALIKIKICDFYLICGIELVVGKEG